MVTTSERTTMDETFIELYEEIADCPRCVLAKTRSRTVPGSGPATADIMFIGEAPGAREDEQGVPFVGAAGKFLDDLLRGIGLSRESVYICNVVKCRPPGNRDPEPDEIEACASYLDRQIALVDPRVIVTLGRFSMARWFPGVPISRIHGTAKQVDGRTVVPMFHPAAALHRGDLRPVIEADFAKLPALVASATDAPPTSTPTVEAAQRPPVTTDEPQITERGDTAASTDQGQLL